MEERMERLTYWCQKVIPLVYEDSLSYYELLGKVVEYINELITNQNAIKDVLALNGTDIDTLQTDVLLLQTELTNVKNGNYVSLYLDSLTAWIDKNLLTLLKDLGKFVTFGLTNEGYFEISIPDNWTDITFSTDEDGRLTLEY